MGTFIKAFYTSQKQWVFITTDSITMMADSTIMKRTDSTMNKNKTDSIMKDSTMKKNTRKTDSTMTDFTTTDSTITTKWKTKKDFTMMAINKITNKRYKRTNRTTRKTNPMNMN